MKVLRHLGGARANYGRPVVTLGNFDGVHRGHWEIIRRAVERAHRCGEVPVAVTFHPHPISVLRPDRAPLLLTSLHQRLTLLAMGGIEVAFVLHFTSRFAAVTAEDFVRFHLLECLRADHVVVGYRVGFGHERKGNAALLSALGAEYGFGVEVVSPVKAGSLDVSSSAIRRAVREGNLDAAEQMLGRRYGVEGRVVSGHRRGKELGFPTANLSVRGLQLPPDGVYAVRVMVAGRPVPAVANLGFNPTFGDRERALEAHLLDFEGDLYNRRVEISFVQRLRGEKKFATPDELARQIERDVASARRVLSGE
jgi:riboflavin kinase / FMN adenylyltransferase